MLIAEYINGASVIIASGLGKGVGGVGSRLLLRWIGDSFMDFDKCVQVADNAVYAGIQ